MNELKKYELRESMKNKNSLIYEKGIIKGRGSINGKIRNESIGRNLAKKFRKIVANSKDFISNTNANQNLYK